MNNIFCGGVVRHRDYHGTGETKPQGFSLENVGKRICFIPIQLSEQFCLQIHNLEQVTKVVQTAEWESSEDPHRFISF